MFKAVENAIRSRSVALVGASDRNPWSHMIFNGLVAMGYEGEIALVNPGRKQLWGRPCYPSLSDVPGGVEHAALLVATESVVDAIGSAVKAGCRGATIYSAGIAEGEDAEAAARYVALQEAIRGSELRLCGPNCMGFVSIRDRLMLFAQPRFAKLRSGPVGVVFQSGGSLLFWAQSASDRGLGMSYAVSSGNEIDLDLADYVNFLVSDEHTEVIVLMVEGIRRPQAFMEAAAKALAARKPILLVKLGRSDRAKEAARSHTGALSGDDSVFDAMCQRYGIVRCDSLDELLETALVFQGRLGTARARTAFVTASGGMKGLLLDEMEKFGVAPAELDPQTEDRLKPLVLPGTSMSTPLDLGAVGFANEAAFAQISEIVASSPGVDIVAVHGVLPARAGEGAIRDPQTFRRILECTEKPVFAVSRVSYSVTEYGQAFQEQTGIAFLQGIPAAVKAVNSLAFYGKKGGAQVRSPRSAQRNAAELDDLDNLLPRYSLTAPPSAMATTAEEVANAAARIGFPVAIKIVSPSLSHKTEAGGVVLGVVDAPGAKAAVAGLTERLKKHDPRAEITGFLSQRMVKGAEIIIGVRDDPYFGPFMVLGLGGIFVEVLKDVAVRLLPVSAQDVRDMLDELRSKPILHGARGLPAADIEALIRSAVGLSNLFLDYRSVLSDIEVNPLIVGPAGDGAWAVDVRLVRRGGAIGQDHGRADE